MQNTQRANAASDADSERLVANLNRVYVRCLDQDRLEDWLEFFTDEAKYFIQSRDNYDAKLPGGYWMYYSTKGMMEDRVTSLRHINKFNKHYYRHMLGDTVVTGIQNGVISAVTSYFLAHTSYDGNLSLFSVGEYHDKVVLVNGVAKFMEKFVVPDNFNSHGPVIIPI
jgi:anthranilate 1,2-dioxygenase small subunit